MSLCDASNKTPIKSIKSPDGDIIDCIHIYDQPAFDHPLLKNHTILMRPSFHPSSELLNAHGQENTNSITQSWQLSGKCPDNTIPILRNQNARKTKKYVMKQNETVSQSSSDDDMKSLDPYTHEHAIAYVQGDKYRGAKATINVWQPYVQNRIEFSLSQIWVVGGHDSTINTIEAGWTVDPSVFGDNKPRLFTYWTNFCLHKFESIKRRDGSGGSGEGSITARQQFRSEVVGLGIGATVLNSSLYIVDRGQRAVLFDRFHGVIDDTIGEGTHFLIP
ncbi:protein neprosin-like [Coffea arabica]|uniref:Protein neprosin-like n=1 Tax=Coffea arabica TaxID=13443 RepID=A0ABM4W6Y0_COFAR